MSARYTLCGEYDDNRQKSEKYLDDAIESGDTKLQLEIEESIMAGFDEIKKV